ncbi:MAG TPA: apolipoprotein N-acyltransferase, partial [Trueperaceae bacterium]|nr:apolipoprotein N-acyltransferase [Trueperaceae bacterium]
PVSAVGYTQAEAAAVHLARFSSVTAVSLAVLLTSGLLLELVSGRGPASRVAASGGLALVALVVWLAWRSAPSAVALGHGDALTTVAVVQPNLPTSVRAAAQLEPLVAAELLERLLQLTSAPEAQAADLVVWPEAAWPGWARRTGAEVLPPAHLSLGSQPPFIGQPPLLLGAASIDTATGATSNAALAWTGTRLTHVFDKRHPVPLAEDGLARSHAPVVALLGGLRVSPLICYDVAFPATVREAARGGAELLAVLTDDTFAAGSDVPLQHLRVALLRAVETGLWLAFASNGGPSALIDPAGRIAALSQAGEQAVISATTRLGTDPVLAVRGLGWGARLPALCGLGVLRGARGGCIQTTASHLTPLAT